MDNKRYVLRVDVDGETHDFPYGEGKDQEQADRIAKLFCATERLVIGFKLVEIEDGKEKTLSRVFYELEPMPEALVKEIEAQGNTPELFLVITALTALQRY